MPELLPTFTFSQSSLQSYMDCPLRFRLRYIDGLQWPAPRLQSDLKFEKERKAGIAIHRLIHQYFMGLNSDKLFRTAELYSEELTEWLKAVVSAFSLEEDECRYLSEYRLTRSLADHNVTAIYDLIIIKDNQYTIIDWKSSARLPNRTQIMKSAQKRLFPLLMASWINTQGIPPESLKIIFWELNFPELSFSFPYNLNSFNEDLAWFTALSTEIQLTPYEGFCETSQPSHCRYCQYRSYCQKMDNHGLEMSGEAYDLALDSLINQDLHENGGKTNETL